MPNFAGSKMQLADIYAGLRAPQTHPPGLQPRPHRKTMFCFSTSTYRQDGHTRHPRQPVSSLPAPAGQQPFRLDSLQSTTLSGRLLLLSRRQPANSLSPHIFSYQPSQPHASQQPSFRLDRPVYSRSHSFSFFFFFHSTSRQKKIEGNQQSRFSSIFLTIPNLVQAFPSQSLSLLFSPSNQYTLPHRPRSGHT